MTAAVGSLVVLLLPVPPPSGLWVVNGVLAVAAVAAAAAGLVLGAMGRTARRQQAGLPPLPGCAPSARPL
ncbi:MAG TPA: hypothetical protein VND02_05080, partial [Actinomycetota bacterium]|nr:hypothetical protein [Actinomycetota bacterium]